MDLLKLHQFEKIKAVNMKFVVIVPTFNEAGNVEKLIRVTENETASLGDNQIELLFVDGNSPDGTSDIIKGLQKEYPNIQLIVEPEKRGLGAAYIAGMKYAMKELKADVVIEMDADFQHDPADLKRFVVQIDAGADYVIGSRFTEGGSIPKDWEFSRKFLSVVGNIVSKVLLNIPSITDYTTGYKASRVKGFLDQIDLDSLASRGFAYKMHLLSEMVGRGATVKHGEQQIDFGVVPFRRNQGVLDVRLEVWSIRNYARARLVVNNQSYSRSSESHVPAE